MARGPEEPDLLQALGEVVLGTGWVLGHLDLLQGVHLFCRSSLATEHRAEPPLPDGSKGGVVGGGGGVEVDGEGGREERFGGEEGAPGVDVSGEAGGILENRMEGGKGRERAGD